MLHGITEQGKNSIKIEDLFCAFRNLIPLSTPLGTGPVRFDEVGRAKRNDRTYEDLARTNRLDRGQTCTLFLLSVAAQALLERHLGEKGKSGRSRGRKDGIPGLRSVERFLLRLVENGARRGVLSFRQFLKSDLSSDSAGAGVSAGVGVPVGAGVGSDRDRRDREREWERVPSGTASDARDTHTFSGSHSSSYDSTSSTGDNAFLLCEVVTDVIFELTEPIIGNEAFAILPRTFFADNAQTEKNLPRPFISSRASAAVGKLPKLPQRDFEKQNQPEIRFPLFLDILRYNLRNVCAECARTLEVYNEDIDKNEKNRLNRQGSTSDPPSLLLANIVKLFVKILQFRVGCIEDHLSGDTNPRSTSDLGPRVPLASPSPSLPLSGFTSSSVSISSASTGTPTPVHVHVHVPSPSPFLTHGQGIRAIQGPGTQKGMRTATATTGSRDRYHLADDEKPLLHSLTHYHYHSQNPSQSQSRMRMERSETATPKKTGELRSEEMEIVVSQLLKILNCREIDESVNLKSDGIKDPSSSLSSLSRDIPCVCGWPLPIGDLGVVGSQKQVEFWLYRIQEYQRSVEFCFSGSRSAGRMEPTRGLKAENSPKEKGERDRDRERDREKDRDKHREKRGLRKSDSERDQVDNYISSDEEDEGNGRLRGVAGSRGRNKTRDPSRGASGSTSQHLRLSLSVSGSGSDSGGEVGGERERKRIFRVSAASSSSAKESAGKGSPGLPERCTEDAATEKSILSGKYSSGKTSSSTRSIKWDDETTHGSIGVDVQKEETLLTYLSLLNQKATMLKEKLRELLQYRAITATLKKGDSTPPESEQKVADMKYIIGNVRIIKSRLESADKQTLDPKVE